MATIPVIVVFGNSNADGYAQLDEVPVEAFTRWTGTTLPTTYPIDITIPGIYCWTPQMPFSVPDAREIDTAGTNTSSTVDLLGTAYASANENQWLYIKEAATGQGQTRRITSSSSVNTFAVSPAFSPTPAQAGTVHILTDSHTCDAGCTTTTIIKRASTGAFNSGMVGKWIAVLAGGISLTYRKIATYVDAVTVTVDTALPLAPSDGDFICVLTGSTSVNAPANYIAANASFREMGFRYDQGIVYDSGYDYPNWKSIPRGGPIVHNVGGATVNFLPELAWNVRQCYSESLYCVHLAVGSSRLSPYLGTLALDSFSWFSGATHNDFHPSSANDLYSILVDKALTLACAEIVAAGDTPDIVGVFGVPSELEALNSQTAQNFYANLSTFTTTFRQAIDDNGWATKQASQIPFVFAGIGASTYWTYSATVNSLGDKFAGDDPSVRKITITDEFTYISDNVHYDADGQVLLGQTFFTEWQAAKDALSSATTVDADRPTLLGIRNKVRRRYERNISSNDDNSAQVDNFINDSLREVYNTLGDNAWFLRRVEPITLDGSFPGTMTLPRSVKRLLRVENLSNPGRAITWKGLAHRDNGRIQLTLHDYTGGPYECHFMARHVDLVKDSDLALIPGDYIELVVMLTCKRLAETAGNMSMIQYYAAETDRLYKYVKRDVLRYDRMRQGQMTTIDSFDSWRNGGSSGYLGGM